MRALAAAANMLIAGTRFHVPVGRHPKSPDPQVMVLHIDGDEGGLGRLQSVEGMRASDLRHDACDDFLGPEKNNTLAPPGSVSHIILPAPTQVIT